MYITSNFLRWNRLESNQQCSLSNTESNRTGNYPTFPLQFTIPYGEHSRNRTLTSKQRYFLEDTNKSAQLSLTRSICNYFLGSPSTTWDLTCLVKLLIFALEVDSHHLSAPDFLSNTSGFFHMLPANLRRRFTPNGHISPTHISMRWESNPVFRPKQYTIYDNILFRKEYFINLTYILYHILIDL